MGFAPSPEAEGGGPLDGLLPGARELALAVSVPGPERPGEYRRLGFGEGGARDDARGRQRLAARQRVDLGQRHDLAGLGLGDLVETLTERPEQRADALTADAVAFDQAARPDTAERQLAGMALVQDLEAFGHGDAVGR